MLLPIQQAAERGDLGTKGIVLTGPITVTELTVPVRREMRDAVVGFLEQFAPKQARTLDVIFANDRLDDGKTGLLVFQLAEAPFQQPAHSGYCAGTTQLWQSLLGADAFEVAKLKASMTEEDYAHGREVAAQAPIPSDARPVEHETAMFEEVRQLAESGDLPVGFRTGPTTVNEFTARVDHQTREVIAGLLALFATSRMREVDRVLERSVPASGEPITLRVQVAETPNVQLWPSGRNPGVHHGVFCETIAPDSEG
jgi:hypothetical protein